MYYLCNKNDFLQTSCQAIKVHFGCVLLIPILNYICSNFLYSGFMIHSYNFIPLGKLSRK